MKPTFRSRPTGAGRSRVRRPSRPRSSVEPEPVILVLASWTKRVRSGRPWCPHRSFFAAVALLPSAASRNQVCAVESLRCPRASRPPGAWLRWRREHLVRAGLGRADGPDDSSWPWPKPQPAGMTASLFLFRRIPPFRDEQAHGDAAVGLDTAGRSVPPTSSWLLGTMNRSVLPDAESFSHAVAA